MYRDGTKPLRFFYVPESNYREIITIDKDGTDWWHFTNGTTDANMNRSDLMLLCPEPKKLSGFLNVYPHSAEFHETKQLADEFAVKPRIACVDLSQFEEGHGL